MSMDKRAKFKPAPYDVPMMTPPTKRWKGTDTNIQKPTKPKKKKGKK